jgi:hypothetical protein
MLNRSNSRLITCIIISVFIVAMPSLLIAGEKEQNQQDSQQKALQQRIDFGNAYIMGQSIKSGAVYLLHRKKSEIDSMLKLRKNYRNEIMEEYGIKGTALVKENETAKVDAKK